MKKKQLYASIIIAMLTIALALTVAIIHSKNNSVLKIVTSDDAGIKDFYIENGNVYIVTGISIKNNTSKQIKYNLIACSDEDYESGLIRTRELQGFDETLSTNEFLIEANATETFTVVFVAENGENNVKHDRLIPEISTIVLQ